jgi:hypothetical protein
LKLFDAGEVHAAIELQDVTALTLRIAGMASIQAIRNGTRNYVVGNRHCVTNLG